jgi:ABC-type transporter Mla MlaB component
MLRIERTEGHDSAIFRLSGDATIQHVVKAVECFRAGMPVQKRIVIDFAGVRRIDPRFTGFLLVLRKSLESRGSRLEITGVSRQTQNIFFLNGFRFFLVG